MRHPKFRRFPFSLMMMMIVLVVVWSDDGTAMTATAVLDGGGISENSGNDGPI